MSPDPVDELFGDLIDNPESEASQDYPGRRKPVNRPDKSKVEEDVTPPWDDRPLHLVHKGQVREWFTIRHLAKALGRKEVTIRSWEKKGRMPQTPFRTAPPRNSNLATAVGRRLWTREQIEGVVKIAEEEGVIVNMKQSPPTQRFALRVAHLYADIKAKEV
jgi:hypothetical protein